MQMTAAEICQSYRQAKNPEQQIKVLADLNLCTQEKIKEILQDIGGLKIISAKEKKEKKEKTKKRLIELVEQGYSNEAIADKMGLTKKQVSSQKNWLIKQGRLPAEKLTAAEPANNTDTVDTAKPSAADGTINQVISLFSKLTNIPRLQVLGLSIRFTDDRGKSWRLDLRDGDVE